jgi:hypothetical protein
LCKEAPPPIYSQSSEASTEELIKDLFGSDEDTGDEKTNDKAHDVPVESEENQSHVERTFNLWESFIKRTLEIATR